MDQPTAPHTVNTKPSSLFMSGQRRPLVDRAEGIHVWSQDGRRFIDAASGPVAVNLGYGNRVVLDAMRAQMERTTFAYRLHFENEPAEDLAHAIAARTPPGLDHVYLVSGGSEAVEASIKLARQWAVATGQSERWKIIGRMPSYHGGTFGSLSVTGDGLLTDTFARQISMMPTIPAPTAWRDRDNLSMEQRGQRYADMLDEKIAEEGPSSVLAFIMEPVGGAATAALVAPDSYYARIREICDRHGILLIHDEVMSGAGRCGMFLAGDHWNCRPDIVALSKGIASGYAPLGAIVSTERVVGPIVAMGGFQHGHTYAGNPLACAAGLAVLGEMDRLGLINNCTSMGALLMDELRGLAKRFPFMADVRGKGLLIGVEMVGDPVTLTPIDPAKKATQRLLDIAYRRGLIIYGRRVKGGSVGDNFMVCPPLIVTPTDIAEIIGILGDCLAILAAELGLPVAP
jgi:adenosylmethionine-8-amino-7-oxononanoate aminotransferase